jgi:hypothetical protein
MINSEMQKETHAPSISAPQFKQSKSIKTEEEKLFKKRRLDENPADATARAFFECRKHHMGPDCVVCFSQVKHADRFARTQRVDSSLYRQAATEPTYSFRNLVRDLCPDPQNSKEKLIKGCQVMIPETVFFREGKPEFFSITDKDQCMALDTKIKLESILAIRKKLSEITKDRWKDTGREA